ncbi:hypothetical protein ABG067_003983 [Albugo candida]
MDHAAKNQVQAPATTQVDDDGTITASGAGEGMARLLDSITDLKSDMGARLNRLEALRVEDDQVSDVSAGSSTFRTYAEARTGLGRNMTLALLEDEVVPGSTRHHAAGPRQQRLEGGVGGMGSPPQALRGSAFGPVPEPAWSAFQQPSGYMVLREPTRMVLDGPDELEVWTHDFEVTSLQDVHVQEKGIGIVE